MILNIFCKKHPKYQAKKYPAVSCDACYILFFLTNPLFGETKMGVGVKQEGLACNPKGVLVGKKIK